MSIMSRSKRFASSARGSSRGASAPFVRSTSGADGAAGLGVFCGMQPPASRSPCSLLFMGDARTSKPSGRALHQLVDQSLGNLGRNAERAMRDGNTVGQHRLELVEGRQIGTL